MGMRASHCLTSCECVSSLCLSHVCFLQRTNYARGRRPRARAVHGAALADSDPRCTQVGNSVADRCAACPPGWLAARAEGVLAALAYARAELLWWFRHWGAVLARPVPRLLLGGGRTDLSCSHACPGSKAT